MPTNITNTDIIRLYELLADKIDEKHKSTRESIELLGFEVAERMERHERDDRLLGERILVIETERKLESARLARVLSTRVSLLALVISVGVTIVGWVVQHGWK